MASILPYYIFLCSFLVISSTASRNTPKSLFLNVTKDASTLQYITQINQRSPLLPINLTLDLGGQSLWTTCDTNYVSSTYRPSRCGSSQCAVAKPIACTLLCVAPRKPGCNNNTCQVMADNTITQVATSGDLGSDHVTIQSTNGSNPGRLVRVRKLLFVCGSELQGLAKGVVGMLGLGRTRISLPRQFSSVFSFRNIFAICLSSSSGVVFFGDGPYRFMSNTDASSDLMYTPLIKNPVSTASYFTDHVEPSSEYFIGVNSIKINDEVVSIDNTLFTINSEGYGGTKISTVNPYTVLHTSIYKQILKVFEKAVSGVPRVASMAPFGLCFNSTSIGSTRVGPAVPRIDLVLQNENVFWRIFGANSMVQVREDVLCVGFVDGGIDVRTSIVIGGHQIEDNLLQFDLSRSRLGFSSSLLFRQTTCANFNFTSNA